MIFIPYDYYVWLDDGTSFEEQKFLTLEIKTVNTDSGFTLEEFLKHLTTLLSRDCLENEEIQQAYEEHMINSRIDDLTGKFLDSYEAGHSRHEVEGYGHYFLGSIVISHKRGQRFVVDGQQRLTTLTLLLIHLHHLQEDRGERVEVQTLVYSEKFGRKSFNLDVPDRVEVMQRLMDGEAIDPNGTSPNNCDR